MDLVDELVVEVWDLQVPQAALGLLWVSRQDELLQQQVHLNTTTSQQSVKQTLSLIHSSDSVQKIFSRRYDTFHKSDSKVFFKLKHLRPTVALNQGLKNSQHLHSESTEMSSVNYNDFILCSE